MAAGFLADAELIPWTSEETDFDVDGVAIGEGRQALEVLVARSSSRPTKDDLDRLWRERWDQRANPVLAVVLYGSTARTLGPDEDGAIDKVGIDPGQLERICETALDEPNRHAARRFLKESLAEAGDGHAGLRNQGLLSMHELMTGVPRRNDWDTAKDEARPLLGKQGKELVEGLGYELEPLTGHGYVLKDQGRESAVAVFLEEGEAFDRSQERFTGDSPVAYGLNKAEQKNVDKVIVNSGGILRLFTTDPEDGFGSRGRTDTFVEVNTNILDEDDAGYIWLLFSAPALRDEGTLEEIMELSEEYAADLGARLRERIYDEVIPDLAQALARARELQDPTREELDETYEMALFLLYRLLFIAYGEDERFLPRNQNPRYDPRSLKQKARELHEILDSDIEFDDRSTTHWDDMMALTEAIHNGHREWGLPEYDGTLLTSDPDISPAGGRLAEVELTDDEFGPILQNLLIDETEDGYQGPVDFRNIGVREFGVIYEGLLESELSVADTDLTVETRDDEVYVPADDGDSVHVAEGEVYLHGLSGERKSTGTYYTKTRFVEHLLDHSLDPALDEHLADLDEMSDREAEEAFWDFSVADIAMGSGHFLVAAVDHIESKFSQYLHERTLPGIQDELDRLKETAEAAFEDTEAAPEIERDQLLRRQIARRCVYGVDINPLATELARLSLWVHTFVPGLPLTFLDYNLVTGDSLTGIGTVDELNEILDLDQQRLDFFVGGADTMKQIEEDITQLGQLADADASEVKEARQTRARIEEDLHQTRAAFDILAASRVDEDIEADVIQEELEDLTETEAYEQAGEILSETAPLHFPVAFPNVFREPEPGFDAIIGNPPWEKAKMEEHIFWARYEPGVQRSLSQGEREERIETLREERPDLRAKYEEEKQEQETRSQLLTNGPYPGIGGGDPDLYLAFSWRFWSLSSEGGRVGVVLPRGAFGNASSEKFRRRMMEDGEIHDITFVKNRAHWAFEAVGGRFTIGLLSFRKGGRGEDRTVPLRGPFKDAESFERGTTASPYEFPVSVAKNWTKTATFPLLPEDTRALEPFGTLADTPNLDVDLSGEWRVQPATELHATQDKTADDGTRIMHFVEAPSEDFWPVYKGSSFDLWNPDTGDRYAWSDPEVALDHVQEKRENSYQYAGSRSAFSEMGEAWVKDKGTLPCWSPRIAFRDITQRTNTRTTVPALIPPRTFVNHSAPYFIWPRGDERDEAYLLGVMSSIPLDWYSRRFVEVHLTYHILKALPIPRPGTDDPLRQRVVELSGRMAAVDDRFKEWAEEVGVKYGPLNEDRKEDMIQELDAVVSHLYGLARKELHVIFETFHEGWDYTDRLKGVLDHYDAWEARLDE